MRLSNRKRSGQMLAMLCICLAVLFTMLSLSVDAGRVMQDRRQAQSSTDFAALAAAIALSEPKGTMADARAAALQSTSANGFTNDGVRCVVTVNSPPLSGNFAGKSNFVEVIVRDNLPGSFSSFLTSTPTGVFARSVAAAAPKNIGVLVLDPGAAPLSAKGNGQITCKNSSIFVNSNSGSAISVSGNASLTADSFEVSGNVSCGGNGALNGNCNTGVAPVSDPLAKLPVPNMSASVQSGGLLTINSSTTLQPGIYGGILINSSASVTLQPGVYIMNGGGFTCNGTLSGSGVMIYNTGATPGAINLSSSGSCNLSAPTGGIYAGVLFFQDRNCNVAGSIAGQGNLNLSGTIYMPGASMALSGQQSLSDNLGSLIIGSLQISGQGNISCSPEPSTNGAIRLVE